MLSCGSPKIIPDDKLAGIFRDALVSNAYVQTRQVMNVDSLNIYEPVLEKYGYTAEDMQYTIGSFSKRKSARLSDVVESTIAMLEGESNFYKRRVALADSIGRVAREHFAAVVYSDTLISVRKIADTALLRIGIPVAEPYTYDVSYWYVIDSLDKNPYPRVSHYLVDTRGRQSANNSRRLRRLEREHVTASFTAEENHRNLVLDLNGYKDNKDMTRPHMTVDSLVVKRYLPEREARDLMGRSWIDHSGTDTIFYRPAGRPRPDSVVYIILPDETHLIPLSADARGASSR